MIIMVDEPVPGHVFVSHVANDPHWSPESIEAVASAIRAARIAVRMDLWQSTVGVRFQSVSAWREWVEDAIIGADHVICLVSPRYQALWKRRFEDSVEGLALQAITVISNPHRQEKGSHGRIITIRPEGQGVVAVPGELSSHLSFEWPVDCDKLLSLLSGRQLSLQKDKDDLDGESTFSIALSDGLILDGIHYPGRAEAGDSAVSAQVLGASAAVGDAVPAVGDVADVGEISVVLEANGILAPSVNSRAIEVEQEKIVAAQLNRIFSSSIANSGMWPPEDAWRAPIGDFPPRWASAWGDDPYGLWADLTVNGVTQRMRWIEPSGPEGFWMGSPQTERNAIKDRYARDNANEREHEPRRVVVKEGFWLADTPCTQAFWTAVVGKNPSGFKHGADAPQRPVESVSWDDVMNQFIPRLAERQAWGKGEGPCLPSEVEWEYAARAGTRTAYWWGDPWDATHGNVDVTGKRELDHKEGTTPVKRYTPNPWGLYDVHGNVWEWCADAWRPRRDAPEARPDEEDRVVRGGSWFFFPVRARAAFRDGRHRRDALRIHGFRFALRSPVGPEAR